MKTCKNLWLGMAAVAGLAQSASAVDITIFDQVTQYRSNASTSGWWGDNSLAPGVQHPDPRGVAEDNETEPGTAIGQQWDLEAFQIHGNTLSVIGGYNFMTGEGTYASGDIFIDVDGDAVYGSDIGGGGTTVKSNSLFKYDYVIDLQQTLDGNLDSSVSSIGNTYTVYKLDTSGDTIVTVAVNGNAESNPWIYNSGGEAVAGHINRSFSMTQYTGGEYAGFGSNNTHNMIQFDLSFLGATIPDGTLFKFTMECGNDNLVGRYNQVPDNGGTMAMLGGGLLALGGGMRLRQRQAVVTR